MHIIPVSLDFDVLAGDERPRGQGVHASDLYNSLFHQLEPKRFRGEDLNRTLVAAGLGWEWQVERALRASGIKWTRPPEFQSPEGVYFNPDALVRIPGFDGIGEIKLTRMSGRAYLGDPRFDKWLVQAKAYCYHLQMERALFIAGHINGCYPRKGEDPALGDPLTKVIGVEFTPRELRENWEMLVAHGRKEGLL